MVSVDARGRACRNVSPDSCASKKDVVGQHRCADRKCVNAPVCACMWPQNDPLFCPSEEDMGLFGAGAAARFSTAFYIKGDGCMDFGFSRHVAANDDGTRPSGIPPPEQEVRASSCCWGFVCVLPGQQLAQLARAARP